MPDWAWVVLIWAGLVLWGVFGIIAVIHDDKAKMRAIRLASAKVATWEKERDRQAVQDFLKWACHTDDTWRTFSIVNLKQLIDRWIDREEIK